MVAPSIAMHGLQPERVSGILGCAGWHLRNPMGAARSINLTRVSEWKDGDVHPFQDCLAAEEPLEVRVNGEPFTVTMRTPGHDLELAAGLLFTEGVVHDADQIAAMNAVSRNLIEASTEDGLNLEQFRRNLTTGSGCGVCGKASIEGIRRRGIGR